MKRSFDLFRVPVVRIDPVPISMDLKWLSSAIKLLIVIILIGLGLYLFNYQASVRANKIIGWHANDPKPRTIVVAPGHDIP
jgi:hypothetical protein